MVIIGTHNSSAHSVDLSIQLHPTWSKWNLVRLLTRILPCVRKRVLDLTINQTMTLTQQLESGVGLLDFYVSYCRKTNTYFCSHTFATLPLLSVLLQIKSYLSDHGMHTPLIILLNSDFETRNEMEGRQPDLWKLITSILPPTVYDSITWSGNLAPSSYSSQWIKMDWYNVMNTTDLLLRFHTTQYDARSRHGLFWTLTPGKWNDPAVRVLAQEANEFVVPALQSVDASNRPPFIAFDHVSETLIKEIRTLE